MELVQNVPFFCIMISLFSGSISSGILCAAGKMGTAAQCRYAERGNGAVRLAAAAFDRLPYRQLYLLDGTFPCALGQ